VGGRVNPAPEQKLTPAPKALVGGGL